jgi:hypothetical protein
LLVVLASALSCRSRSTTADAGVPDPIGPGAELDAVDEQGQKLRFRVDRVESDPLDHDGDVSLYALSVRAAGAPEFRPYCAPDAQGKSLAIPVHGSWDARGSFHDAGGLMTFACTSGAIAKCIRFGYKPWKSVQGRSLAQHHLACVRMVRADYCGDGVPHTVDGTQIDLWDDLGIQKRELSAKMPEVFEAAWSPAGATYLNVPRWADTVDDVVRLCPERLRGRTSKELVLPPDELPARFPASLLFNARFVRAEDRKK